jgi:hypothetical protein
VADVGCGHGISTLLIADAYPGSVHADVTAVLQASPGAFDAIMLDTDNGPDGMLISENASLYAADGIASTVAALRGGGRTVGARRDGRLVRWCRARATARSEWRFAPSDDGASGQDVRRRPVFAT